MNDSEINLAHILDEVNRNELSISSLDDELKNIYIDGKPPVTIEQFIEDDYYFKRIAKDLYPDNLPDLLDIFNPKKNYIEIILTGATSIGKTFMASIAACYMIYQLSCFINPHKWVGSSTTSPIVFINMSITATKAKNVVFSRVKSMIDQSPYFCDKFKRNRRLNDTLEWKIGTSYEEKRSGQIIKFIPGTGDSLSALGEDIFAGIGDELNFFRIIQQSKRSQEGEYDPAQRLYDTISRRIKGRFMKSGLTLGKFFLLSSAQYPDDFIERRVKEAEEDGSLGNTIKIIRKSIWQAKRDVMITGYPVFSKKTFRVEIGTSKRGSRLIDEYDRKTSEVKQVIEPSVAEGKIINPPIDLYDDFFRNIEGAVRDFGGETTRAIAPFFTDVSVIYDAIKQSLYTHPWTREETTLRDGSQLEIDRLFEREKDKEGNATGKWKPRYHSEKARYWHGDLAESGDSAGLSIIHIAGWRQIMDSQGKTEDRPIFMADLMLRINPPPGEQITFSDIRIVLFILRDHGMYLYKGSCDSFQSTDFLQIMESNGLVCDKLSIDRDVAPYTVLKDAFFDRRIIMYNYEPVITELIRLERNKDKIDHPPNGCFTGDTKVALLDGRNVSFEDLVREYSEGKKNWAYSIDFSNKKIVSKEILNPRKTFDANKLLEITLNNGEKVRCTAEHRFMLSDGSFIEAQYLKADDSLMPLYRKYSNDGLLGYELLYSPFEEVWHYTHTYFTGKIQRGFVRHHVDFNPKNNNPENIKIILRNEHKKKHNNETLDYTKISKSLSKYYLENKINPVFLSRNEKIRQTLRNKDSKQNHWRKFKEDKLMYIFYRLLRRLFWKKRISEALKQSHKIFPEIWENSRKALQKFNLSEIGRNTHAEAFRKVNERIRKGEIKRSSWIKGLTKEDPRVTKCIEGAAKVRRGTKKINGKYVRINHKIIDIKEIEGTFPVYDLTIEGTENFALSSGVFVHNSKDVADSLAGAVFNAFMNEASTEYMRSRVPVSLEHPIRPQTSQAIYKSAEEEVRKWLGGSRIIKK